MSTLDLFRTSRATASRTSGGAAFAPRRNLLPPPAQWYSAVMGTGIVGVVIHVLAPESSVVAAVADVFWLVAATLLVFLIILTIRGFVTNGRAAVTAWTGPATMYFLGVVSMGFMTVGHGAGVVAADLLGSFWSLVLNRGLWVLGSLIGIFAALAVPYLMIRRDRLTLTQASGVWFLPVVPPVVSAATGVAVAHLLGDTVVASWVLTSSVIFFAMGIAGAVIMFALLINNLVRSGAPAAVGTPALLLPLGPLGQGATAAVGLGFALDAGGIWSQVGLAYAEVSLTIAAAWSLYVAVLLVRAARIGMPFTLGWWSFTFPIGTCVTGAAAVHLHTGSVVMGVAAIVAAVMLFAGWSLVATKSAIGAARGVLPGGRNFG